jgi:peptidoglycan/LPS O-acetylase OafA/YrhL
MIAALRRALASDAVRLGERARGRDNNFPLLRHVAAGLVVLTHAFALSGHEMPRSWYPVLVNPELGNYSVKAFFTISGFLVTRSFIEGRGSLRRFVIARALRIYPALIAAVVLGVALAAWANALPAAVVLSDPSTWTYAWRNAAAWSFVAGVTGSFPHNPIAGGPNGSLWSLPLEVRMYALVAIVGAVGMLARPRIAIVALIASVAAIVVAGPWELPGVASSWHWVFVVSFLLGMTAYLARDAIPVSFALAAMLIVPVAVSHGRPFAEMAFTLALPYWVLVLAYHPALPRVRLPGDYSYGIYVYAFPLQQTLAHAMPGLSAATMLATSVPLTLAAAALSWHALEQPMLRRKPAASPRGARTIGSLKPDTPSTA